MDALRDVIRSILRETYVPAPGTVVRVVEPVSLNRTNETGTDTFGHEEKLIFVGSDGVMYQVRSPRTGQRYAIPPRQFDKVMAPMGHRIAPKKGRPVPPTLRGMKV